MSSKDKGTDLRGAVALARETRAVAERNQYVAGVVSAFESETAAVLLKTTPTRVHSVVRVLGLMIGLALFLCAVVKLDVVVAGDGRVVPSTGAIYISPLNTGLVREVGVKAGDVVKKGQALAKLDPTAAKADFTQVKQRLQSDQAQVARLEAEHDGRAYVPDANNPYAKVQHAIWKQRQAEYQSSLANFDGQIRNAQAQIASFMRDEQQYTKREKLASDLLGMYQPLLDSGDVSRLQYMAAKDSREEVARLLSDSQGQIQSTRQTLSALIAQKQAYIEKWHADAGEALVTTKNDLDQSEQLLQKANLANDLSTITAPVDGIVLRVSNKVSVGSVAVAPNENNLQEPLITLVPADAPLEVQINVATKDVGFIRVGDTVQLKLDAFAYTRHGTAGGVVSSISEGSFTLDENGQPVPPYFKVRVRITETKLRNVPENFRILPGMTVIGDVLVGRRTILSYLVSGVLRTGSEAMREPG